MLSANKLKKCAVCRTEFSPHNSMIKHCSPDCAYKIHTKTKEKKWAKEKRAFNLDNKSISKWIAEAQIEINTYIRLRDHKQPCISCGSTKQDNYLTGSNWDAGHYRSTGSAPHMRFNLNNIFKQCVQCNRNLSGNSIEMRKGIIKRIGLEKLELIENQNGYKKYNREYCERVKTIFKKKSKILRSKLEL